MTCKSRVNAPTDIHGRMLRIGAAVAVLLALPFERAVAADWPDNDWLRGSLSGKNTRWEGIHFGANMGLTNMNTDFGNSASALIAFSLRNTTVENELHPSTWTTLPANTSNGRQFGGFIGYNVQYEQVVLGFDAGYNKVSSLQTMASDSITRIGTTSDTYSNTVSISVQSQLKMIDYATARVRAGYAMGQFLPYAVFGAAVGRFNYATTATTTVSGVSATANPLTYGPTTDTQSNARDGAITAGAVFGLGLDVAILPNLFLRGEWEFVAWAPLGGIRANTNTGRIGIALKF